MIAFSLATFGGCSKIHRILDMKQKRLLFDGKTLQGWHPIPRLDPGLLLKEGNIPATELRKRTMDFYGGRPEFKKMVDHRGRWEVVDGAIVGAQDPPGSGLGAYLITDETFGDFNFALPK